MPKVYKKTVEAYDLWLYMLNTKSIVKMTEFIVTVIHENKRRTTNSIMNAFYNWATTCSGYYCKEYCAYNTRYNDIFSVSDRYTVACWLAQKYLFLF